MKAHCYFWIPVQYAIMFAFLKTEVFFPTPAGCTQFIYAVYSHLLVKKLLSGQDIDNVTLIVRAIPYTVNPVLRVGKMLNMFALKYCHVCKPNST